MVIVLAKSCQRPQNQGLKAPFLIFLHFCLSTGIITFCETGFQPIAIIFSFLKSTLPKVSKEKRINEKFQVAWIL
jgi:hypothetical protein